MAVALSFDGMNRRPEIASSAFVDGAFLATFRATLRTASPGAHPDGCTPGAALLPLWPGAGSAQNVQKRHWTIVLLFCGVPRSSAFLTRRLPCLPVCVILVLHSVAEGYCYDELVAYGSYLDVGWAYLTCNTCGPKAYISWAALLYLPEYLYTFPRHVTYTTIAVLL
jgi:hypothetical protein